MPGDREALCGVHPRMMTASITPLRIDVPRAVLEPDLLTTGTGAFFRHRCNGDMP